ncbi:DUF1543 domain-containing protein [Sphingobacterium sp. SGL-16]|uniref:DUF1543 domain-containing protein n=2 Tax=Sphingobacteriaceae TaxID=84566 RepID=A0ABR7YDP6_9SPHI|nr:DUF1543 domain-containing protein [Sphingobacterium litopenaei]NGM73272.1 DUF1543 domain-containing protein [Sphingobacterium sp. SGL-16]
MIILGCNLKNRFTEQHDVFFDIAPSIKELKQNMYDFWPEAGEKLHIDSYRTVRKVDQYKIQIVNKDETIKDNGLHLYFLNLGGYKPQDMEEYHYKQLVVATSMAEAIAKAKKDVFWSHHKEPHVDNKYGIDVDDAYLVDDMLSPDFRFKYKIHITANDENLAEDELHIGYLKLSRLN